MHTNPCNYNGAVTVLAGWWQQQQQLLLLCIGESLPAPQGCACLDCVQGLKFNYLPNELGIYTGGLPSGNIRIFATIT